MFDMLIEMAFSRPNLLGSAAGMDRPAGSGGTGDTSTSTGIGIGIDSRSVVSGATPPLHVRFLEHVRGSQVQYQIWDSIEYAVRRTLEVFFHDRFAGIFQSVVSGEERIT
jgi:hypothetical protein